MTNERKLQHAIDRIRSRLAGEWYYPSADLESDIKRVLDEMDGKRFFVFDEVIMLVETSGEDHEGNFHTLPPGAKGMVEDVERRPDPAGWTYTVAIQTDDTDEYNIVNVFDEEDGPITNFIKLDDEEADENPFDPESPEGRAWDEGRMASDGALRTNEAEDHRPRYSTNRMRREISAAREYGMELAAALIVANVIQDTSAGKTLVPRQDGNQDGLHYAAAIRAEYLKLRNA
jgi:hypothetical protein